MREVIQAVEMVLKKNLKVIETARRNGDPPALLADYNKASLQLNWSPRFTLFEMIQHAWNAYV